MYARKLQEVLGGQYGEISVALQYQFQAWNMHIPGKYRDMVLGIGAEEMGHVEMLATMIAQLLEKSPLGITEDALQDDPTVAAIVGGTDVQHAIVAGAGARPVDSNGNAWQGSYITASGNLLADFTANENAEMQGRVHQYLNFSDGAAAADGPWASGPSFDGKGEYSYHDGPTSSVPIPPPTHPDVRFYGTTELPNVVEKTAGLVQDTLNKE
ncbi:manganese catalase family protein [Curtobacterium sp. C1]|nr:manganese catalase family protein [Curtobacterium sp. C1]